MRVVLEMNLGLCLRREQLFILLAFRHGDINVNVWNPLLLMLAEQRLRLRHLDRARNTAY